MSDLIVYGSLMSSGESARFGLPHTGSFPVSVRDYRREFSQEPSWREGSGKERGILTALAREGASFNAVLLCGVPGAALRALDHRERGYDRVEIPARQLAPLGTPSPGFPPGNAFMYVGNPQNYNPSLKPNGPYLRLCLESAAARGEEFLEAFLDTTFVGAVSLRSWAARRGLLAGTPRREEE